MHTKEDRLNRDKMRILLATEAAGGGVGRHILDLADGLSKKGHEVHVIYSPLRMDKKFAQRKEELNNVNFSKLPVKHEMSLADIKMVIQLRAYIKENGPFDIVHGHSSKAGALMRLSALGLNTVSFYTPHAFSTMNPNLNWVKRKLYSLIEQLLALISDGIILVSEDEYGHANSLGLNEKKLHIVHNGIAPIKFQSRITIRKELGISGNEVVIGFVGRLVPQKAPDLLLKAFKLVEQEFDNIRLIYIGDGPLKSDLEEMLTDNILKGKVYFLGEADGQELISAFDIFALPSLYEGMPYVLLEALSAGLPIIATRVGGVRELVEDGVNGYLALYDKVNFADKIKKVIMDTSMKQMFSFNSREKSEIYTLERMTRETINVYMNNTELKKVIYTD
ncbi:MAG: hypothetical protein APF84_18560 [Gracilibacter sp. BRH_c7a]|nr:MAG: hypothetical protein APF84_18560 [Gracilibacter sp. BRH_c7a]